MDEEKLTKELGLTKKQDLFCRNYVANGHNGTEAAISAGYSKHTAKQIATENLSKLYLVEFINTLEKPIKDKLGLDKNWVLTRLKRYSEANITDFFEIKTQDIAVGKGDKKRTLSIQSIHLKDLNALPKEMTDCIQEISQTQAGIRLKLVGKRESVVDVGRTFAMFTDRTEDVTPQKQSQFDVSKLTNDDLAQLSNMLKRIQKTVSGKELVDEHRN